MCLPAFRLERNSSDWIEKFLKENKKDISSLILGTTPNSKITQILSKMESQIISTL